MDLAAKSPHIFPCKIKSLRGVMEVIFGQKIVRNGIFLLFLGVLLIYCPYALKSYKFVKNLYFLRVSDKKSFQ